MINTVDGLRPGQLVCSLKGRDQGNFYLIKGLEGERFLLLVDSFKHSLANPKRKNVKHVKIFMLIATEIEEALAAEKLITDSRVAIALKRLQNELQEGDRFHG